MKLPGAGKRQKTPKSNLREVKKKKGLFTMMWAGIRDTAGECEAPQKACKLFRALGLTGRGRSCSELRADVLGWSLQNRIGGLRLFSKLIFGIEGTGGVNTTVSLSFYFPVSCSLCPLANPIEARGEKGA